MDMKKMEEEECFEESKKFLFCHKLIIRSNKNFASDLMEVQVAEKSPRGLVKIEHLVGDSRGKVEWIYPDDYEIVDDLGHPVWRQC